ncbi:MAG TPA: DUF1290 domain-containing protein [Bacillales bacterium]|nr:DUF1290 domain-containing protein [Bacillales bacterium]
MWLAIIGLMMGVSLGLLTNFHIPGQYSIYLAVAVLAGLNTLFGGARAYLQKKFNGIAFAGGFFSNLILAVGLAFLGVQLGVDLYLAAVFALGVRLFHHLAEIRSQLLAGWTSRKTKEN